MVGKVLIKDKADWADPILGLVEMRLKDAFADRSQFTRSACRVPRQRPS